MSWNVTVPQSWVDIAILAVVAWNVAAGVRRGFMGALVDLLGFLLSLAIALTLYVQAAEWAVRQWSVPDLFSQPLAFAGLWVVTSVAVSLVGGLIGAPVAAFLRGSTSDILLSLVPSVLKGAVVAGVVLTLLLSLPPLPPIFPLGQAFVDLREAIQQSELASPLVERTAALDRLAREVVGESLARTLTLITVKPEAGERIVLNFKVEAPLIDTVAENQMLDLLNDERRRAGLSALVRDSTVDDVARAHSMDMLQRGYFAHENPEGLSPFDRMRVAGIRFTAAGENLALAPTVVLAHQGLMDSPGHRANILSPQYGRVGIGAALADGRGRVFTQSFTN